MNVEQVAGLLGARAVTDLPLTADVKAGYTSDLLSHVLAKCDAGAAWVTVQTHLNVIAVAVLLDMACIIVPDGVEVEQPSIDKANEEGMAVLVCEKSAYEICGLLFKNGIPPVVKE
jgi:hypothetical protein